MNWFSEGRDFYSRDWFNGMQKAYPDRWELTDSSLSCATLVCRHRPENRVVLLVSGGGSDGPWVPGCVGEGMADACVIGAPYTAPNAYAIYQAAKDLDRKQGVLLLYNNFMGDYLNNDMAAELLAMDGVNVCQVPFCDDMGMARGEPRENRGGRAAGALLIKLASRAAREGLPLEEVARLTQKASMRTSTLCVTVDTDTGTAVFGEGFSEEPGFFTRKGATLRQAAADMVRLLTEDLRPGEDEKIFMLVNRLRLTSYSDGYVFAGYLQDELSARFPVQQMRVGSFFNILDRYGFTVTLLCADREIQGFLDETVCTDSFLL